jgi:hypothetical protein
MEARLRRPRRKSVRRDVQSIQRSLNSIVRALTRLAPALEAAVTGSSKPWTSGRTLRLSAARRSALKMQGQYMGHLRGLKPRQKARVKALRATKGIRAAISFAKTLARTARR